MGNLMATRVCYILWQDLIQPFAKHQPSSEYTLIFVCVLPAEVSIATAAARILITG